MAQQSPRLNLIKPDLDDNYNINVYNGMIDTLDDEMVVGTGVLNIAKVTQAQYDAITTPDARTLYVITGDGSFKLAVGDLPQAQSGATVFANPTPVVTANAHGAASSNFEEDDT